MKIEFFHPCNPPKATAQQRRHSRSGHTYLPAGAAKASATLQAIFEQKRPETPICGPLELHLYWTWQHPKKSNGGPNPAKFEPLPKTTRPDLDNLAKLALDAMTRAGYWHDDSQVVRLVTEKWYSDMPGIAVRVEQINNKED
jgi:Holliday junction resolvase RusA-like endonuclease